MIVLPADPSRAALQGPLSILGLFAVGSGIAVAAGARHLTALPILSAIGFVCVRVWAARTRLSSDSTGVTLCMPLATWHAPWASIASLSTRSFFTPTHRGGIAAGVILRLTDGASRSIPDVFPVGRDQLAKTLNLALADALRDRPKAA